MGHIHGHYPNTRLIGLTSLLSYLNFFLACWPSYIKNILKKNHNTAILKISTPPFKLIHPYLTLHFYSLFIQPQGVLCIIFGICILGYYTVQGLGQLDPGPVGSGQPWYFMTLIFCDLIFSSLKCSNFDILVKLYVFVK